MPIPLRRALATGLAALSTAAVAATPATPHDAHGLLPSPPTHAPPGVCYARVSAPARYGPPLAPGAHWRLSPPPPGAPGPLWCLVIDPAAPPTLLAPEREGWIRVLCDADATHARMRRLQRRLKDDGDYAGEVSGRYDASTARAVARFQGERRIAHDGYLSLRTMEAIERGDAPCATRTCAGPASYAVLQPFAAPVIPPPPPPVIVLPAPRPDSPPSPAGRWLSWPGKRLY